MTLPIAPILASIVFPTQAFNGPFTIPPCVAAPPRENLRILFPAVPQGRRETLPGTHESEAG